jgi:uncharacterized membrane protein YedE/YeeE
VKPAGVAVLCGILFGAGLVVSDMINPARVLAFLDVTGAWDPTLALVMGGALVPSGLAYLIRRRMTAPVVVPKFDVPTATTVDRRLIVGAALFGVGWGIVGLCPGPAIAALATLNWGAFVFVGSMIAGMALYRLTNDSSIHSAREQSCPET